MPNSPPGNTRNCSGGSSAKQSVSGAVIDIQSPTKLNTALLPAPADRIVARFAGNLLRIEPGFVSGIYLTGSISLNDFYPEKSDIDFLVLCNHFPDQHLTTQLKRLHRSLHSAFPKPDLSGCYLTPDNIRSGQPEHTTVYSFQEGVWRHSLFEMGPVSLSELKTHAITVFGRPAADLPVAIGMEDLQRFLHRNINSYWANWIARHADPIRKKALLVAFPRFTEWSVLGVARQLVTLHTGRIVSKTEAGQYCLAHLPAQYHPVIQEALTIRRDRRTYPLVRSYALRPSFGRAARTIECVRYMIDCFNRSFEQSRYCH